MKKIKVVTQEDGEQKHVLEVIEAKQDNQSDCNLLKIQYLERENQDQKFQIEKLKTIQNLYQKKLTLLVGIQQQQANKELTSLEATEQIGQLIADLNITETKELKETVAHLQ